ncbi:predicted protein [Streptomyces viridochromogenes DSM 40736]|uniref:Predicted protein n=1 Tax=Streptomyces viridochromogenes (strain DSM 40736 / JCM 4977 / BCRC 1201 / Tue 494) TaxID=591159 RepID=D9X7B4_STRVT|nr:predicted protein [Streptomyces viridochromogenes DSM 40736]
MALLVESPVVSLPSLAPPTDSRRRSADGVFPVLPRAAVRRLARQATIETAGGP